MQGMSQKEATDPDNGYPKPGEPDLWEHWWIENLTARVKALPFMFRRSARAIRTVARLGTMMDLALQTVTGLHHDPKHERLSELATLTREEADQLTEFYKRTTATWTHYHEASRRFQTGLASLFLTDASRKALFRRLKAKGYVQSICGRICLDEWDEGDWPPRGE